MFYSFFKGGQSILMAGYVLFRGYHMGNDNETYDVAEEQEISANVYNKEEYAAKLCRDGVLEVLLLAKALRLARGASCI